jgi:glucose/arabinose dehydrogenase
MPRASAAIALALLVAACGGAGGELAGEPSDMVAPAARPEGALVRLTVEPVASGLTSPVAVATAAGDTRIFVAEKPGTIRIIEDGTVLDRPYVDLSHLVEDAGLEQGLVGIALHPDFAENGRVFVSFTNRSGDTRIMEYRQDAAAPDRLDRSTGRLVLAVDQPHEYHNGGSLEFGPDGNLWIGLGDGGGIGDPWGNGQDPTSLLGAVLRIDVDAARPYAIPTDNPFADGTAGAPEVWAYGLRNPWRLTFTDDDHVIIADVGHELWEEANVASLNDGGGNYGWPVMEGPDCFADAWCDAAGLVQADLLVPHRRSCAIVGGPVYRGQSIPELDGSYLYADFCVGWVRSARWDGAELVPGDELSRDFGELGQITALAEDAGGEILILTLAGDVFRVVAERS